MICKGGGRRRNGEGKRGIEGVLGLFVVVL
nr:MAG TPA: hypothetical protein [Caudoviricetes sp.]